MACKVGLEALLEEYEATLCPPVRLEILRGARKEDRARLEVAFAILPFQALSSETWVRAVRSVWKLRDAGLTVPWNDVLVGALSVEMGCRVYAKDPHFEQMRDLVGVRLYVPGYGGMYAPDTGG